MLRFSSRSCRKLQKETVQHGYHGIEDVALSIPTIVGKNGAEKQIPLHLSEAEEQKLQKSADTLKSVIKELHL